MEPRSANARYARLLVVIAAAMLLFVALGLWSTKRPAESPSQKASPIVTATSSPPVVTASTTVRGEPPALVAQDVVAAIITQIKGNASVTQNGKILKAVPKMKLTSGDIVQVSPTGSLVITWTTYGRTVLSGGTRLIVGSASESNDTKTLRVRLKLETGRVWTRLQRLLTADSSFEVRAQNVVATVRGTSFGVAVEKNKKVKIQVMESYVGVSHVKDVQGAEEVVGAAVVVAPKEEVVVPVEAETSIQSPHAMTAEEIRDPFVSEGHQEIQQEELEVIVPTTIETEIETEADAAGVVNALGLEPIEIKEEPQTPPEAQKLVPTRPKPIPPPEAIPAPKPKQSALPAPSKSEQGAQKTKLPTDEINIEDYLVKDPNARADWLATPQKP